MEKLFPSQRILITGKPMGKLHVTIEHAGYYIDGAPAIVMTENGLPYARVTVCLADWDILSPPGHCYVKTWEENRHMLEWVTESGAMEDTGERVIVGNPVDHMERALKDSSYQPPKAALCKILLMEE